MILIDIDFCWSKGKYMHVFCCFMFVMFFVFFFAFFAEEQCSQHTQFSQQHMPYRQEDSSGEEMVY